MILEYYRVRPDAIPPSRANPSDAGLDVHFNPDDGEVKGVHLEPGESTLFSTGLKFGVPHGYMLEVKNRSGNASKRSLLVGACVIDSGYDGEVFVNLHNVGRETQFIERGMKIAQIVMVPVVHFRALETSQDNLYNWYPITMSDRGSQALGSTDEQIAQTEKIDYFGMPVGWELGDKL
jgi:dUTP pyrophosphatase|tara:strand:+ start:2077 stop:2610 length:534 start_codon:yes stop_codon:yes gene_type:complete